MYISRFECVTLSVGFLRHRSREKSSGHILFPMLFKPLKGRFGTVYYMALYFFIYLCNYKLFIIFLIYLLIFYLNETQHYFIC